MSTKPATTFAVLVVLAAIASAQMGPPPGGPGRGGPPMGQGGGSGRANPRPSATTTTTTTETMRLLSQKAVQSDLALTRKQWTALDSVARGLKGASVTEDTALAYVAPVLTQAQNARLRELLVQDLGYNALALADVRSQIGLTDDQAAQVDRLVSASEAAKRAILSTTTDSGASQRAVAQLQASTGASLAKLLTAEQDRKLRALAGKALR